MSNLVTGLRDPYGRVIVTVPLAVRHALMEADTILRLHGIQFELICETCHDRHPHDPNRWTITAQHGGDDDSLNGLICGCSLRKFVALM